jgi:hypothetical protein
MPRMNHFPALLLLFCLCIPGNAGGQVFMRPVDPAAVLALGGAGLAIPSPGAGLSNPARLGLPFHHVLFAAAALPYGLPGWQSFQAQFLHRIDQRSGIGAGLLHAGLDVYREQRFQLGYGRRMGERFLLGAEFAYLRVAAAEYGSAGGVAAALSLLSRPLPELWIAARLQPSMGVRLSDWPVPDRLQFAAGWQRSDALLLLAELEKDIDRPAELKFGVEYRPSALLRLRCGMRSSPARPAMGVGLRLKNGLVLDTAAEWHPVLGITPALALSREK